ncbi:hypothetical protein Scep_012043 [Stephania cephalantha]|uniref:Uncharacterized protein n=1 Tax=Stephania cephalantha TaxID=152367 RepID=A0AAP0JFB2_9MAGN
MVNQVSIVTHRPKKEHIRSDLVWLNRVEKVSAHSNLGSSQDLEPTPGDVRARKFMRKEQTIGSSLKFNLYIYRPLESTSHSTFGNELLFDILDKLPDLDETSETTKVDDVVACRRFATVANGINKVAPPPWSLSLTLLPLLRIFAFTINFPHFVRSFICKVGNLCYSNFRDEDDDIISSFLESRRSNGRFVSSDKRPERPVGGVGGEAVEAWEKERRWPLTGGSWRRGGESLWRGRSVRWGGWGGEAVEAWEKKRRWIADDR